MTNRKLRLLLLLVGVPVGMWHAGMGMRAIFVFREGEPLLSWVAVILGFMFTLPLVLLSWWSSRAAGIGLLATGALATVATLAVPGASSVTEMLWPVLRILTLPLAALGLAALAIDRNEHRALITPVEG